MTVKLEPTALTTFLRAASAPPCPPPSAPAFFAPLPSLAPPSVATYVGLVQPLPRAPPDHRAASAPPDQLACPDLRRLEPDEDSRSVDSITSLASSGASSSSPRRSSSTHRGRASGGGRRVTFADSLVTTVHTRPYTREGDKRRLYYTQAETDRFRQAYRDERQSSASPLDAPSADREPPSSEASAAGAAFRRRISRVVVEYDDVKATYHDPDDYPPAGQASNAAEGVFFDTDGFWSGAISWY